MNYVIHHHVHALLSMQDVAMPFVRSPINVGLAAPPAAIAMQSWGHVNALSDTQASVVS